MQELVNRAKELLESGEVARVLGWKKGDLAYNPEPAYFNTAEELKDFVYNGFCGANLSKYMIEASKLEGKTMVCLKPCDTYSFNQLIKEHRVDREKAYIVGVGCKGKLDIEKAKKLGIKGIENSSIFFSTGELKVFESNNRKERIFTSANTRNNPVDMMVAKNKASTPKRKT